MTRPDQILAAAVAEAQAKGFHAVTRQGVAARAGVSEALVSHHMGTMVSLKRNIMRAAVRDGIVSIVAEGLASRDKQALKASEELRIACGHHVSGV